MGHNATKGQKNFKCFQKSRLSDTWKLWNWHIKRIFAFLKLEIMKFIASRDFTFWKHVTIKLIHLLVLETRVYFVNFERLRHICKLISHSHIHRWFYLQISNLIHTLKFIIIIMFFINGAFVLK